MRVPAGPVLAIAPFNFPLNLVAHKLAPALACGCSVVLKPPPQTPLTSLLLAECIREAGAPEDAVQVVPCEVAVAETLVRDDRFATLSFTGSAEGGLAPQGDRRQEARAPRARRQRRGDRARRRAPRLGAASASCRGAFGYAGQVCIKVQRLYVHRAIADAFVAALVDAHARASSRMSPLDPTAVCGPMIDEANARRVRSLGRRGDARRARACSAAASARATAYWPTVLEIDGDGRGLKVVDEEVFGPVLTVHRYDTWDEALRMADGTPLRPAGGRLHRLARRASPRRSRGSTSAGLVVNDVPTFRVDSMPYGGTRDSGLGREGVRFAIEEMTERKLLVVREG